MRKVNAYREFIPLTLLLLLGVIWGSGYSIARYAMLNGVSPAGYTFWQSLGPAVILSLLSWRHLKFNWQHLKFYFICGLIGIAVPNTNMYFASSHVPAGLLALIVNIVPIIIYPLALITKQETFQASRFMGVLIAIVGIMILVLPKASLPELSTAHWLLVALLTPVCFALFALFINPRRPADSNPLSLAAGMLIAATLLLSPWVYGTHQFYPMHWHLNLPDKIILLEIALSSVGYVIFFWLIRIAGPVYYSLVDGIVALTGLTWGEFIFGEVFHWWTFTAIILILAGIGFVTIKLNAAANTTILTVKTKHAST